MPTVIVNRVLHIVILSPLMLLTLEGMRVTQLPYLVERLLFVSGRSVRNATFEFAGSKQAKSTYRLLVATLSMNCRSSLPPTSIKSSFMHPCNCKLHDRSSVSRHFAHQGLADLQMSSISLDMAVFVCILFKYFFTIHRA